MAAARHSVIFLVVGNRWPHIQLLHPQTFPWMVVELQLPNSRSAGHRVDILNDYSFPGNHITRCNHPSMVGQRWRIQYYGCSTDGCQKDCRQRRDFWANDVVITGFCYSHPAHRKSYRHIIYSVSGSSCMWWIQMPTKFEKRKASYNTVMEVVE